MQWIVEDEFRVRIGGNTYINTPNLIMYGEESLFRIYRSTHDGVLGIDFDIYDENGGKIATIRKNMIVDGNKNDFKIIKESDRYAIIEKSSERLICDIRKRGKAKDVEIEVNVQMYTKSGFLVNADQEGTNIRNSMITGNLFRNCKCGIYVEPKKF